jgi:hypothetical protein
VTTAYAAHAIAGAGALPAFFGDLARSSFGVFRKADLPLPSIFYFGVVGFFGLAFILGTTHRSPPADRDAALPAARVCAWLASTLILSIALVVWNGVTIDAQPQGRYLLPALVPVWAAVTCVLGRRSDVALGGWLAFLAVSTGMALALVHAHPCL